MKTIITLLLIFSVSLSFGQTKTIYDHFADSMIRAGQQDKLMPYFEKELKTHPKHEDILRWLGYLNILENRLDLGEKYYREALAVNPVCARCYMNMGRICRLKQDDKTALEWYNKAVGADPKDAVLYVNRAGLKEQLGDKTGALMDYNKAIALDSANVDYYLARSNYNAGHGYFYLALADADKAISLQPGNYRPYHQRSGFLYDKGMLPEALTDINKALERDSSQAVLYSGRGAIYSALKDYSHAIRDYDRAIALDPNDYLPYYNRYTDRYHLEDLDGSCADLVTCYNILKKEDPANSILQSLEISTTDYCDSTKASYYYQRGIANYNLAHYDKAIAIYTTGLKKFPGNTLSLQFRGNAYFALRDYEHALTDFYASVASESAIIRDVRMNQRYAKAPNDSLTQYIHGFTAASHLSIAESKFALGHYDEALAEINKGIAIAPTITAFGIENYYNVRGNCYLALAKYEMAIKDFDQCIRTDKDFAIAYVNRAVAKVNMASQAPATVYAIRGGIANQTFNANWTMPLKSKVKKSDGNILSALSDCNKAIDLDPNLDYAYYIRGQIKRILVYGDYCDDLVKAKTLGYTVEPELLKDCGR